MNSHRLHTILHESINHVLNETHILNNLGGAWKGAKNGYQTAREVNNAYDADYDNWWEDDEGEEANLDAFDNEILTEFNIIYKAVRYLLGTYFCFKDDNTIEVIRQDLFPINKALRRIGRILNDNSWGLKESRLTEWNFPKNVYNGLKGAYHGFNQNYTKNGFKDIIANKKKKYNRDKITQSRMNLKIMQSLEEIQKLSSDFIKSYSSIDDDEKYQMVLTYYNDIMKCFQKTRDYVREIEDFYGYYEDNNR